MAELSVLIAIVAGVSEILKQHKILQKKYIPLANVVVGMALCLAGTSGNLQQSLINGTIVGLMAGGFYSSGRMICHICKELHTMH